MSISQDLAVQYEGEGFPVLIVHGWTMSGAVEAADFEPAFSGKSGYRRIYVDLPGMGKSPAGQISDLDSIFERVADFVERQILPSSFLLAGSSCGAYIARALAYKYASAVDGLLLRVPLVEGGFAKRDIDSFTPAIANQALLASLPNADWKKLGHVAVQTPEFVELLRRKLEGLWLPAIAASDSAVLDPIRGDPNRYRLTAAMHTPEIPFPKPTLILTGRQDTVVGYRDALPLMACYTRASLAVLDRADHGLPIDEIDLFNSLVHNWLWRIEEVRRVAPPPGDNLA